MQSNNNVHTVPADWALVRQEQMAKPIATTIFQDRRTQEWGIIAEIAMYRLGRDADIEYAKRVAWFIENDGDAKAEAHGPEWEVAQRIIHDVHVRRMERIREG